MIKLYRYVKEMYRIRYNASEDNIWSNIHEAVEINNSR